MTQFQEHTAQCLFYYYVSASAMLVIYHLPLPSNLTHPSLLCLSAMAS